jgi:AraC family transcriptional activator FtrA
MFSASPACLLDGRRATTHWMHGDELTRRWPAVRLDPNVLFTQDDQIFTSAGECAGLDLCLHLIRLDHGSRVARINKIGPSPYRQTFRPRSVA